jgi:hypothetical protein
LAVNIVVVLGSAEMHAELQRRLGNERTAHGETITFILLDKSDGVAERDRDFMKFTREAAIKEYFFGDAKRTLSPFTQSVGFDDVAVFKAPDGRVLLLPIYDLLQLTLSQTRMSTATNQPSSGPRSRQRCPTGRSPS